MTDGDATHENVRYLTGSPQRPAMLRALCESPLRPTELSDRVDATRTTVQRVLSGFVDRGWVVKRDGRYRATPTGRRVRDGYDRLCAEVAGARELAPVAGHLHRLGEDLPPALLTDAAATVATESAPLAPVDRLLGWFEERTDEHVAAVSPVVSRTYADVATAALERDVTLEVVLARSALAAAGTVPEAAGGAATDGTDDPRSTEGPGADEAAPDGGPLPTGNRCDEPSEDLRILVHPGDLSAGLLLGADEVCLCVLDDRNALVALLESGDPDVRAWARRRYESVREAARPLSALARDPS